MASDVQPKHEGPLWKPTKHQLRGETPEQHGKRKRREALLGYRGSKKRSWKKLRDRFLAEHKSTEGDWWACSHCGHTTLAPEVDHIIKRSVDPSRVLDATNLQILCHECHLKKDSGMVFK